MGRQDGRGAARRISMKQAISAIIRRPICWCCGCSACWAAAWSRHGSMAFQGWMKLAPIACDLALAAVCFAFAKKRLSEGTALGVAVLLALNPAFIVTSSCWGQIDSVLALLLVLMLLEAQAGKWHIAIPIFALAVLAKPQGRPAWRRWAWLRAQRNAAEREARQICWLRPAGRRGGDAGRCASVCMGRKYFHCGWWINTRRRSPAIRTRRFRRAT